jgi:hypothetical protein
MTLEDSLNLTNKIVRTANYKLSEIPKIIRNLYLVDSLNYEIANGGVEQWLVNITGGYTAETHEALTEIGAISAASLVLDLIKDFPNKAVPQDEMQRSKIVNQLRHKMTMRWRTIGDGILEWPDDIDSLLRSYVDKNIQQLNEIKNKLGQV